MICDAMVELQLPYTAPPLRSNDRMGWRQRAPLVRSVRAATALVARQAMGPQPWRLAGPLAVELVWVVTDGRIRDAHGPDPTLKAAQDGLVDAQMIVADDTRVVVRSWCSIERGPVRKVLLRIHPIRDTVDQTIPAKEAA